MYKNGVWKRNVKEPKRLRKVLVESLSSKKTAINNKNNEMWNEQVDEFTVYKIYSIYI